MADFSAVKHLYSPLPTDFKTFASLLRTKQRFAFAYGFMFAFVVLSFFLAFSPSQIPTFSTLKAPLTSSHDSQLLPATPAHRYNQTFPPASNSSKFPPIFDEKPLISVTTTSSLSPLLNITISGKGTPNQVSYASAVSIAMPPATNASADVTPSATNASADVTPSATNASADVTPSATNASADVTPSATNASADVTPSVNNASADVTPSVNNASADFTPSVTNASAVVTPSVTNASAAVNPLVTNASAAVNPLVSNASTVVNPSVTNASAVVVPPVNNASAVVNPSVSNASAVVVPPANNNTSTADTAKMRNVPRSSPSTKQPQLQPTANAFTARKQGKSSKSTTASLIRLARRLDKCDFFDGEWVRDDTYPLYKPGACSFIDEQFNCMLNGRPDGDYQKYKWKPKGCALPRLSPGQMVKMLTGKTLAFVGDSLNRNMWESLVCILTQGVKNKANVYEAKGRSFFKGEASYSFVFKDYNLSVDFHASPFLVQESETTLRLDVVTKTSEHYKNADIIVFNTGHWWTHEKTSLGKNYYQEGSHVYPELNVVEAFRKALTTWGKWVDGNVKRRSVVMFRGYSETHFSGGQWNSGGACDHEREPIRNVSYLREYSKKMVVLEEVMRRMKTKVVYLNITRMTDYRKDGHPSMYRKKTMSVEEKNHPLLYQDCSHWCLPGVPDAWNEILYSKLLLHHYLPRKPT